ncbi:DUF4291 domain-containing protein [Actinomadura luteofluorescens]|uniref:DUF4291 domain-containing protein n=1 Tax=Actinomadura luteofluorescens TaxID=46163 RepID=UPI00347BCAF9
MRTREIRACYDRDSITVYQAYAPEIGVPAARNGTFVPPFSRSRMTWIKPSFLWLMARSDWARKPGQETILAVRISRAGWEEALGLAVPTDPDRRVFRSSEDWRRRFAEAVVHVQWDPERSLHGRKLEARSIQIGLSRHIVDRYVDDWILGIEDLTPLVRRIQGLRKAGRTPQARALLPDERPYPLTAALVDRLGASEQPVTPDRA